jgi:acyl-coenzyme A synthetase/AMP-(fatty) acid ligase
MSAVPLISHRHPASLFAFRNSRPVTAAQFIHEVRALAAQLPDRPYMLNLCTDRYRFAAGFCAALLRGQTSLLPPSYARDFVAQLAARYAGTYSLAEAGSPGATADTFIYPDLPATSQTDFAVPHIPAAQRAALVFTSGSTGEPLAHEKSWGGLRVNGQAEAEILNITADSGLAILGTVPPQHMYGIESTVLIAMHNGLALVAERPFYPADIRAQLHALPEPRCLVTTPVHLRALLDEADALPSVQFVMCATAPLSLKLAADAEARFAAPLYEIYGCTETGQIASRRTATDQAWTLMRGIHLSQDERGTYAAGGHVERETLLNDVIELNEDGRFTLHGRTADMVSIAGKRTSLASLNHHLTSIAGVKDGVFMLSGEDGEMVSRPTAFVVAPGLSHAEVMRNLRERMDAAFLPRPLYFVDALPRNPTGKLTRAALEHLREQCAAAERNAT